MTENYYLKLFKEKLSYLKVIVEKCKNKNFSDETIDYIVAGQIIILNSMFEATINKLQSVEIEPILNEFYQLRQQIIYFEYFNDMKNIANKVSNLTNDFNLSYEKEQNMFLKFVSFKTDQQQNNIVIKVDEKIKKVDGYYHFNSNQNDCYLMVPENKIFSIAVSGQPHQYIVDLSENVLLNSSMGVSLINDPRNFFKRNYTVVDNNINNHYKAYNEILTNYMERPFESPVIFNGKNKYYISDFLNNFQANKRIEKDLLNGFTFEKNLHNLPYPNFSLDKLNNEKLKMETFYTTNEAFYIDAMVEHKNKIDRLYSQLTSKNASNKQKKFFLISALDSLYALSLGKMSDEFKTSTPAMKKANTNIRSWRNHYSHEFFDAEKDLEKNNQKDIFEFYENFSTLTRFLYNFKNKSTPKELESNIIAAKKISTNKENVTAIKSKDYVRVKDDTCLSPLAYSLYYTNNDNENIDVILPYTHFKPLATIKKNRTQKNKIFEKNYKQLENKSDNQNIITDIKFDFDCAELLNSYNHFNKKNTIPYIIFKNSNTGEKLQNTIIRIKNYNYVMPELLCEFKISKNKNRIELINNEKNVIATIVSKKEFYKNNITELEKDQFSMKKDLKNNHFLDRRIKL